MLANLDAVGVLLALLVAGATLIASVFSRFRPTTCSMPGGTSVPLFWRTSSCGAPLSPWRWSGRTLWATGNSARSKPGGGKSVPGLC